MRYTILVLITAILLFGCVGGQPKANESGGPQIPPVQIPGTGGLGCTPSFSFAEPAEGVLSKTTELTATATCAAGSTLTAKIDGVDVASASIATNDNQQVKLEVPAVKDGTVKLSVESAGGQLFARDWKVKPLGSEDISGLETDAVLFKEWRAMAVDVDNAITPGRVRIYMKRMQFLTQPATLIVVELRKDNGGNPGDLVASVERPMNVSTMTDNWINFDFASKPSLAPGRYWITVKVKQTEDVNLVSDVIQLHYVPLDKQAAGNDYTRQMKLSVNEKTGFASETQWTPLSYDRKYSIVLTSG